jgi:hypothetical protein
MIKSTDPAEDAVPKVTSTMVSLRIAMGTIFTEVAPTPLLDVTVAPVTPVALPKVNSTSLAVPLVTVNEESM